MNSIILRFFKQDRWVNGFVSGLFAPIVTLACLIILLESFGLKLGESGLNQPGIIKQRSLALICLCLNLLLMQSFKKLKWDASMRGLAISTFICVSLWLVKYLHEIF